MLLFGRGILEHEFLFVGNQLALDFLNTRPFVDGVFVELLPDFEALVLWFRTAEVISKNQAAVLLHHWRSSPEGRRVVESMRELRERLRAQVIGWEDGGQVSRTFTAELNELMAEHPMRTRLKTSEGSVNKEQWFKLEQPSGVFAPLASSAAALFTEIDRTRVRQCGQCVLHFYDASKKGTRRWCSMLLCGNRVKVAAYAARQRASE